MRGRRNTDRVDVELRALNADSSGGGLVNNLIPSVISRHIGRSPADVEANGMIDQPKLLDHLGTTPTHPMTGAGFSLSQLVNA